MPRHTTWHATSADTGYISDHADTSQLFSPSLLLSATNQIRVPSRAMASKLGDQLAKLRAKAKATKAKASTIRPRAGTKEESTFMAPKEWIFSKPQPAAKTVKQAQALSGLAHSPPPPKDTQREDMLVRHLAMALRDNAILKKQVAQLSKKDSQERYYQERWSCLCGEFRGHVSWDQHHTSQLRFAQILSAVRAAFSKGHMHPGSQRFSIRGMHPMRDYPEGAVI